MVCVIVLLARVFVAICFGLLKLLFWCLLCLMLGCLVMIC